MRESECVSCSQSGGEGRQKEGEVGGLRSGGILRPGTDTNPLSTDKSVAAPRVVSAVRRANPSQA